MLIKNQFDTKLYWVIRSSLIETLRTGYYEATLIENVDGKAELYTKKETLQHKNTEKKMMKK
jgi:hypothetical protein